MRIRYLALRAAGRIFRPGKASNIPVQHPNDERDERKFNIYP